MFVIRTVDYNENGHREDRLAYEMVFEDRADAQHKADNDNEAEVTHIHAMRCITHKNWNFLHVDEPTREKIEAEFTETSIGFNYVEEWEFMPSTRRTEVQRDVLLGMFVDEEPEDSCRHGQLVGFRCEDCNG